MADGEEPLLSATEARKRYLVYLAVKLAGLSALFGGVLLARDGVTAISVVLLVAGAGSLFVRPWMLGLTTRAER